MCLQFIVCDYSRLTKPIPVKFSLLLFCLCLCLYIFSLVYVYHIHSPGERLCITYMPQRCTVGVKTTTHQAASNHAEKFAVTKESQIWNSNWLESLCMFTISRAILYPYSSTAHMNYKFIILMYTTIHTHTHIHSTYPRDSCKHCIKLQTTMYKFLVSWFFLKVIIEIRYIEMMCGLDMHTLFWLFS